MAYNKEEKKAVRDNRHRIMNEKIRREEREAKRESPIIRLLPEQVTDNHVPIDLWELDNLAESDRREMLK